MHKYLCTFVCFILCCTTISATNIDSLKQQILTLKKPTQKSKVYIEIAQGFNDLGQSDSLLYYSELATQQFPPNNQSQTMMEAQLKYGLGLWQTGDFDKALATFQRCEETSMTRKYWDLYNTSISYSAIIYAERGQFDEAIEIWKRLLEALSPIKDKLEISKKYNNIGLATSGKGEYEEASKYYIKGLAIAEELKDTLMQIRFINNLGNVYREFGDTIKSLKSFEKIERLSIQINNKKFEGMAYNQLGTTYQNMGMYSKALQYFEAALENKIAVNEKVGISNAYGNIAHIQFRLKNLEESQAALDASMELIVEMGIKFRVVGLDFLQAEIFMEQGKYEEAIEILEGTKVKSKEVNTTHGLKHIALALSKCYANIGQIEAAENEILNYSKMVDDKEQDQNAIKLAKMESQYELEKAKGIINKKEAEIASQQAKENYWKMLAALSLLAITFLGWALRNKYKLAKLIKAENNQLISKNQQLNVESTELKGINQSLAEELNSINEKLKEPDYLKEGTITLSNRQKTVLKLGDIIYIKASQNGVQIVTTTEKFIYWKGIGKFQLDLPQSLFVKTHRSYIVNKAHVKAIQSEQLKMSNGELVRIGGGYKDESFSKIKE